MLTIPITEETERLLAAKDLSARTGMYSPDLYLRVPLHFAPAADLASHLESFSHLEDWLYDLDLDDDDDDDGEDLPWPSEFVPIAVMNPVSDEDQETYANASASETEEFYAIHQKEDGYPVYCWTHSVGFELRFPTLELFLDNLVSDRPATI